MTKKELEASIEAILFTLGESVDIKRITTATEESEENCLEAIAALQKRYSSKNSGIQLIELDHAYQLCTKQSMYEVLVRVAHTPKKQVLTDVLLETLSIIAYKQPITKLEIEHIRGVKCDHVINKLVEYNLVCEAGRLDAPGRPILFATTEDFLRNFGIESLEDLPTIASEKIEDFKEQAEEEVEKELAEEHRSEDEN